ncbi:MAG TPA: Ldh family oxidoreductase [Thermodesulfobacteriota bacterium]|nr:Ldh family oxidoreductase [Thermodesulfobacteriota bacterium]
MEKKESLFVPVPVFRNFSVQSFVKCGLSQKYAEWVSDTLIQAELRGVSSHGVIRLPFYCKRLLDKGSNSDPNVRIIAEKPSMILVDGDNGLGQIVSIKAMEMVMDRARDQGVCFAGVGNSCHFGMTSYYPMMALKREMIALAGSNASPVMAPWGGGKSAIGNNPLAIVVPTGKGYPLVLDMAMSVISGGKIRLEAVKGTKIPKDWILDGQGRPTDNPRDFMPDGTLLPLGYKGFGLAVMIEVLSGILTRSFILDEIPLWFEKSSTPVNLGHFFMALDIGTFIPIEAFKRRVDQMIDRLKSSPPMEGSSGIFMPGEMEHVKEQEFLRNGIPVAREVLKTLDDFAEKIGIQKLPC